MEVWETSPLSSRVLGTASRVLGTSGELSLDPGEVKVNQLWSWWENPPVSKKPHAFVGVSLTNPRLPPFFLCFFAGLPPFLEEKGIKSVDFFGNSIQQLSRYPIQKNTWFQHQKQNSPSEQGNPKQTKTMGGIQFVSMYLCPLHVVFQMATKNPLKNNLESGIPRRSGASLGVKQVRFMMFDTRQLSLETSPLDLRVIWCKKENIEPKIVGPQNGGEYDGDLVVNQWILGTIPKNQQQKHIQVFQNH